MDCKGEFLDKVLVIFEVENYDEIFGIIEWLQVCEDLDFGKEKIVVFVLGLKLFLEIMMENCKYLVFVLL